VHPAPSIILFTTASGAGYGLLFLLGLAAPLGLLPADRWFGLTGLGLALGLVTLGLLSSTLHLGHPERAWRAVTQWRSSWLSREGVMALMTYVPAALFGLGWVILEDRHGVWAVFAVLAAAGAALTVACTGMIYASLKPIRQWCNGWVVPVYLVFALMTGALWLSAIAQLFGLERDWIQLLVLSVLLLGWGLKLGYWFSLQGPGGPSSPESATGLGALGRVRLLDPPHTQENYLLREMGFRIARKHAERLRGLALIFGLGVPFFLSGATLASSGWLAAAAAMAAALSGSLGVVIERWLFFAEARHTVMLYYGRREA
jgi:DMSO reductase anchor subunit